VSKLLEMNIVPETVIWREKGVKGVGSLQKWIQQHLEPLLPWKILWQPLLGTSQKGR